MKRVPQKRTEKVTSQFTDESRGTGELSASWPQLNADDALASGLGRERLSPKTEDARRTVSERRRSPLLAHRATPDVDDVSKKYPTLPHIQLAQDLGALAAPGTHVPDAITLDVLIVVMRNGEPTLAAIDIVNSSQTDSPPFLPRMSK